MIQFATEQPWRVRIIIFAAEENNTSRVLHENQIYYEMSPEIEDLKFWIFVEWGIWRDVDDSAKEARTDDWTSVDRADPI